MLTADELAGMRTTLEASLPDTCAIERDTLASNSAGGHSVTTATVATVACRVAPLTELVRNAEADEAQRIFGVAPWVVTVPHGTDVGESDRIASGGRSFEIAAVLGPRSDEIGLRLACRLVNGGA